MLKKTNDLNIIYELDQACFDDFYSWDLLNNLSNHHHFYLIKNNNKIIGFIIVHLIEQDIYELIKIGILKTFQNQGHGYSSMLELLNKLNFNEMLLEVDENNAAAIQLYLKLGFKYVHKRKQYYKNGNSALIFSYKK